MKAYRELEVNEMKTENVIALKKKIENAIAERRNFSYRVEVMGSSRSGSTGTTWPRSMSTEDLRTYSS